MLRSEFSDAKKPRFSTSFGCTVQVQVQVRMLHPVHRQTLRFKFKVDQMWMFYLHNQSQDKSRSNSSGQGGPTQRASALAALNSAFNPSSTTQSTMPKHSSPSQASQRAAAVSALSNVLTAERKPDPSPPQSNRSSVSEVNASEGLKNESVTDQNSSEIENVEGVESVSENNEEDSGEQEDQTFEGDGCIYPCEQLKSKSTDPVTGIDFKRREAYLSDEEFQSVLGMTKELFYQQPKWKQDMRKRKVDLF